MNNIFDEILNVVKRLLGIQSPHKTTLFASGTGIPDKKLIEFYKDTDILIIARDGLKWRRGVRVE